MFSINPAFDMRPATENLESMFGGYDKDQLSGIDPDRARFYQMCEENNVGLTVMKGYFGGAVLADNTTGKHIEKALFTAEEVEMLKAVCFIKYVDDKPIAFAQSQLRYDYVEGTESSPVGYLEGILGTEDIGSMDTQKNFWKNARSGPKKKAVQDLKL